MISDVRAQQPRATSGATRRGRTPSLHDRCSPSAGRAASALLIAALLAFAAANLVLSGVLLRIGGQLTKGPYLPETMAGLTKTTRAIVGR